MDLFSTPTWLADILDEGWWAGVGGLAGVIAIPIAIWLARKPNASKPETSPGKPTIRIGDLTTNRDIQGRAQQVDLIADALAATGRAAIVRGQGGVGKSSLARLYAQERGADYTGVLWVAAEEETTLRASVMRLQAHITVPNFQDVPEADKPRTLLEALPQHGRWLVIFDNVDSEAKLKGWWPPKGVEVLITTRWGSWSGTVIEVPLDILPCDTSDDPGPQVLMTEARKWDEPETALKLAQELGGLPLGLVIAGAMVRDGASFAEVLERIWDVIGTAETHDFHRSITAAVQLSYDLLGADARAVVDVFAWYEADGLDAGLLTDVPGSWVWEASPETLEPISDDLRALCADPGRVAAALRELERRSLLTRTGQGYSLHRLTAEAIRGLQGDRRAELAGAAAAVLAAAYPGGNKSPELSKNWPACARLTPHVLAYRRAVEAEAPVLAAVDYLLNQTSIYLHQMADHGAALDLAEEFLRLKTARLPEGDIDVAIGHSMLGLAFLHAGRGAEAVTQMRRAVALGKTHNHGAGPLAVWLNNLGSALWQQYQTTGDRAALEEARQVQELCLDLQEQAFGADSAEVAHSLSNLASILNLLGDRAAAIDAARRGLAIERDLLPPGDARLGVSLTNLGGYLLNDGAAAEAVEYLDEALDLFRRVLPEGHPHIANTASWLCAAYLVLGRVSEARALADTFDLDWDAHKRKAAQFPAPVA